jgi:hypothetical protein
VKAPPRAAKAAAAFGVVVAASAMAVIALVCGNPATASRAVGVAGSGAVALAAGGAFAAGLASAAGAYWAKNRARPVSAKPTAAMRTAARLMPPAAGQEWLAEARSILFECPAQMRRAIIRSYLFAAPQVLAAAWGCVLTGRLRAARGAWVSPRGGWGEGM